MGSDYVRYDWSACATLGVMHYTSGAPFERLESLHQGWGIPMPDANQWEMVSEGDDLGKPWSADSAAPRGGAAHLVARRLRSRVPR